MHPNMGSVASLFSAASQASETWPTWRILTSIPLSVEELDSQLKAVRCRFAADPCAVEQIPMVVSRCFSRMSTPVCRLPLRIAESAATFGGTQSSRSCGGVIWHQAKPTE